VIPAGGERNQYLEDYVPGASFEYGPISVGESEIVNFAEKFDPQYIHTDPEKAARGPFKGLIASGWQTTTLAMRLYASHFLPCVGFVASPRLDELRWRVPVRPGDSLRLRVTVLESQPSPSEPDRGVMRALVEFINQNGQIVMTAKTTNILLRRPSP
jgi:acyl dehydratase